MNDAKVLAEWVKLKWEFGMRGIPNEVLEAAQRVLAERPEQEPQGAPKKHEVWCRHSIKGIRFPGPCTCEREGLEPQGAQHSYAIGAGGGDDGCSACGAGQHEPCREGCAAAQAQEFLDRSEARHRAFVAVAELKGAHGGEWLLCPNGCKTEPEGVEYVRLIPGQRCPECRQIALFDH